MFTRFLNASLKTRETKEIDDVVYTIKRSADEVVIGKILRNWCGRNFDKECCMLLRISSKKRVLGRRKVRRKRDHLRMNGGCVILSRVSALFSGWNPRGHCSTGSRKPNQTKPHILILIILVLKECFKKVDKNHVVKE